MRIVLSANERRVLYLQGAPVAQERAQEAQFVVAVALQKLTALCSDRTIQLLDALAGQVCHFHQHTAAIMRAACA